jgi:DNA-binding MarR family transcriptional regulator
MTEEPLVLAAQRAAHDLARALHDSAEQLGLSQAELHILAHLDASGAGSTASLHSSFGHRRSTLTSILDRLESRGLIQRRTHPDDRRSFLVELTADGAAAARRAAAGIHALDRRIRRHVTHDELRGFRAVVAAIEKEST